MATEGITTCGNELRSQALPDKVSPRRTDRSFPANGRGRGGRTIGVGGRYGPTTADDARPTVICHIPIKVGRTTKWKCAISSYGSFTTSWTARTLSDRAQGIELDVASADWPRAKNEELAANTISKANRSGKQGKRKYWLLVASIQQLPQDSAAGGALAQQYPHPHFAERSEKGNPLGDEMPAVSRRAPV